jgi:membrane fusion protein, macrolide-specific efflux system
MLKLRVNTNIKEIIIFIACSIIALALSGCYFLPKEEAVIAPPLIKAPPVTFDTIEVKKGTIEKVLSEQGRFVSVTQYSLAFTSRAGHLKAFNIKEGSYVRKGDVLALLDTDSLESQIRDQQINVRRCEIWYEEEKNNPTATENSIEIKKLDLEAAKNRLNDFKNEYNKSKIVSPVDGVVVFVEKVNFGDYVSANRTLIVIADPTKLQVEYTGASSSNFKVGDEVTVRYNQQDLKGKVVMTPANVPADAHNDLKSSIRVSVDELPSGVSIGHPANIVLVQARKEDAIKIPRGLINNFGGRSYVYVLENDVKVERDVEVGIQTAIEAEIVSGLNVGDKVIVR